jgi:hypothetical protein
MQACTGREPTQQKESKVMAVELECFPSSSTRRYPWEQWLNGAVWQLFPGEDFASKPSTMLGAARSHAKRLGGTLRTRTLREGDRETVVIQFIKS